MFSTSLRVFVIYALTTLLQTANAATPNEWRSRSIYQIFTDRFARTDEFNTYCVPGYRGFCGGTWQGITNKLDYIQGMGFTAIWISPVVQNVADSARAYHGYSATNLYGLNSNFGTAGDLKALAKALQSRGMYLMVDVVANHFGYDGSAYDVDYSTLNPFNQREHFHVNPICFIEDYANQIEVEQCWIGDGDYPLPDVNTTHPTVREGFSDWLKWFIPEYSIDGLRVDTVKHVEKPFWPIFNYASNVYNLGEVLDGNIQYFCPYQNYMDGLFAYPIYFQITQFFSDPSATSANLVRAIGDMTSECKDTTLLGSFSENHDQARFANYTQDMALARNIIAYTMIADGIPVIYQGQEQHFSGGADPYDREALWTSNYDTDSPLYNFVKQMNAIRSMSFTKSSSYLAWKQTVTYSDGHIIAIRKGEANSMTLMVTNNLGEGAADYNLNMPNAGFATRLKVVELLSCREVNVDQRGGLDVQIISGLPSIYYPQYLLPGTGWCGY
ncbi:glycoside hydrolase family 13 protein [Amylocarpus encephaloides]|uniref:alpha-amylase n=1 Tax=Amylocarpus encephaloides TaxID=45428 RepID=A0A9P7YRT7_9HELO|nr:glycoside hydrolase family 13 protein [Amylocarpus encephaloides]